MKRIKLAENETADQLVIGIASDEPIFKLGWELNQSQNWNLKKVSLGELSSNQQEHPLAESIIPLLFASEKLQAEPLAYYEDLVSERFLEIIFFEASSHKIPKEIRAFRYILLIRSVNGRLPDVIPLIQQINGLSFVTSAVDISHLKHIKTILP